MHTGRVGLVLIVVLVAVFGLSLALTYLADTAPVTGYAYSQLLSDAAAGKVDSISQEGTSLTVVLSGESTPRTVTIASDSINVYAEVCAAAGAAPGACEIDYRAVQPSAAGQWVGLLISALLPVLLIGSFIFFMMRQAQRKGLQP